MAPGQAAISEPPSKRQRTGTTENRYDELKAAQYVQRTGDVLTAPAVTSALDRLIAEKRTSGEDYREVEAALKAVKESLDALPKKKTVCVNTAITRNTLRRTARGVPLSSLFNGDDFEELALTCKAPASVNVVGSFLLGYSSDATADIAVQMPSELFESKDYLNYRYHNKRMMYLIYLARHFAKTEEDKWCEVSLTKSCLNNDSSKPVLSVSHVDYPSVTVRIIPSYAEDLFEKKLLAGSRKNVRIAGTSSVVHDLDEATPEYNASVWMDSTFLGSLKTIHAVSTHIPAFADAVLLLKVWSTRQRLLKSAFVLAAALADISEKGLIPKRAPREHLFRSALNAIRGGLLKRLSIGELVLCDSYDSGFLARCEDAAGAALCVLERGSSAEDPWFGILPYLFTTARGANVRARPLSTMFDGFIRISGDGYSGHIVVRKVRKILQRALVETGRVTHIEHLQDGLFGIRFESEAAVFRKVDTRPNATDAKSFRDFWGQKAGLRRFKDGKIVESLVWEGGRDTVNEICQYVFERHFGDSLKPDVIVGRLEEAAQLPDSDTETNRAIAAFDELATLLRSLDALPLKIRAVHATAPHLRRCGAHPLHPHATSRYIEPLELVATFESSGAWPEDPVAISAAKAAFYVALRSTLAERGLQSKATISFLDIQLAGFIFRLRICVDKEKKALPEGSENLAALLWETEHRVQHHDNVKHIGNPMMGKVSTMAKCWLNKHLLLSQMGDRAEELVELFVGSIMSRPDLSERKSTAGYFCQFLHLLAEFPWEVCPLAVLFRDPNKMENDEAEEQDDAELERFMSCAQRRYSDHTDEQSPFAVYNTWNDAQDDVETWFSEGRGPERAVASRIVATARSSLNFIESFLTNNSQTLSLRTIFATPTNAYDVVLDLDKDLTPADSTSSTSMFRKKGNSMLVGFDPVWALRSQLENKLGKFAIFLAERFGRPEIFVVWRPEAHSDVKFSLRDAPFMNPNVEEKSLRPSRKAMVAEMCRIGKGFVTGVRYPKGSGSASLGS